MAINIKDVEKIAKLARIEIGEEQKNKMLQKLDNILNWMEILDEINSDGTGVLANIHNITLPLFTDQTEDGEDINLLLKNAPQAKYNYFTVPKVLE